MRTVRLHSTFRKSPLAPTRRATGYPRLTTQSILSCASTGRRPSRPRYSRPAKATGSGSGTHVLPLVDGRSCWRSRRWINHFRPDLLPAAVFLVAGLGLVAFVV